MTAISKLLELTDQVISPGEVVLRQAPATGRTPAASEFRIVQDGNLRLLLFDAQERKDAFQYGDGTAGVKNQDVTRSPVFLHAHRSKISTQQALHPSERWLMGIGDGQTNGVSVDGDAPFAINQSRNIGKINCCHSRHFHCALSPYYQTDRGVLGYAGGLR